MMCRFSRLFVVLLLLFGLVCGSCLSANASENILIDERIAVLETLGLKFSTEDVEQLKASSASLIKYMPASIDRSKFTDYPQILSFLGLGKLDEQTWAYSPRSEIVYSFDAECMDMENAYHDFLMGIAHISGGEIAVTDYQTQVDEATYESGIGEQIVQFALNDQQCLFTASFYYDWLDCSILDYVNNVLVEQGISKRLWSMSDQGQGLVIFYNSQDWADEFCEKTGHRLYTITR